MRAHVLWIGLALSLFSLTGCGLFGPTESEPGDPDTDQPDPDPDTEPEPEPEFFEPFLATVSLESGVFTGELGSTFYGTDEYPPYVVVDLFEEAYLDSGDDRYACSWVGWVDALDVDDLGLGDGIWIGWEVQLTLADTDCTDLDPEVYGSEDATAWLEDTRLGLGFAPLSDDFAAELAAGLQGWETDYAPYAFSGLVGVEDDSTGELIGLETNLALSFALDEDHQWIVDGEYLVPQPVVEDPLESGYVRTFPWYGIYASAL